MSFWSSSKIEQQIGNIIDNPRLDRIDDAAYELSLGAEVYVSGEREKTRLEQGEMVAIAPGQIALLLTEEKLTMPKNVMGLISLKTSVKVPGLVNVSGFHVDPGFEGHLVFTVYNAGSETCAFLRGQLMFKIWFAELDVSGSSVEQPKHRGSRQGQSTIRAEDISRLTSRGASPARLDERLRRLEIIEAIYGALILALLATVIAMQR